MSVDWENLSDEELMNLSNPEGTDKVEFFADEEDDSSMEAELDAPVDTEEGQSTPDQSEADDPAAEGEAGEDASEEEDNLDDAAGNAEEEDPDDKPGSEDPNAEAEGKGEESTEPDDKPDPAGDKGDGGESDDKAGEAKDDEKTNEEPDYKTLYEQVTAPFNANGKEFRVESPEEAIRLMQQGANYVKKMTALKPNLKLMRMLQNQDLLDEEKLTFLIDINRRDPAAIQKLLKDGNIDPMTIDTDEEVKYSPGDHKVSDEDMAFRSTLDDVLTSTTGSQTIKTINDTWDARSKEEVYRDPDILRLMDQHRQSGIYDRINDEIDRQRTLGDLSENTPFLEAYKTVGDKLHAAGRLFPEQKQGNAPNAPGSKDQPRTPVGRSNPKRNQASNGDRAKAASPTRSSPKTPPREFDPLAISDEDLMKL